MITRRYQNAEGQQQEVTLSAEAWEALTEDGLQNLLGFKKPELVVAPVVAAAVVAAAAPSKRKRR